MNRTASLTISKIIAASLLAGIAIGSARADKYVEISNPDPVQIDNKTYFDVESPKLDPATNGVRFTYRTISPSVIGLGNSTLEYTAIAWCSQLSMWNLKVDGVGQGYKFPVKEFYKDGKGWIEYPNIVIANFTDPSGKLITAACNVGRPRIMDELLSPEQDFDCMKSVDEYSRGLCSTSNNMRGNITLLTRRITSIGQKCGNKPQLEKLLVATLSKVKACTFGDDCVWFHAKDLIFAVIDDAHALEIWESSGSPLPFPAGAICNVESKMMKKEAEGHARRAQDSAVSKAVDAFFACARRNIGRLDDKRSDATVITRVIHRTCSNSFYDLVSARKAQGGKVDSEELKKTLEDKLLELVLTNRSSGKAR